jgi:C4-dicarboxylate-specific signal transduction histidine kinase
MKRLALVLAVCAGLLVNSFAWAEDAWKQEFEQVCAQTDNAMNMTVEQLREYVTRCEKIKPAIEALEPSPRKVFLKRLQLCRDLYKYVLDSKEAQKSGK